MRQTSALNRRELLKTMLVAASAGILAPARSAEMVAEEPETHEGKLLASPPMLLNPSECSMDVAFAIGGVDASGWVEVSLSQDMSGAERVHSGDGPLMKVNRLFAVIRLRGLKPATRYFYRIGADRIRLVDDYKPQNLGSESSSDVFSFQTLGAGVNATAGFCAIQDTHATPEILDEVLTKIAEIKPSAIVWNGDARNFYRSAANAIDVFLRPHPGHPE